MELSCAVVPGYYLVCYNMMIDYQFDGSAVVPGYYLVCYNTDFNTIAGGSAVVPGYYLVCYNLIHSQEVLVLL